MKTAVNRADLLQYLSITDKEQLTSVADCFSFRKEQHQENKDIETQPPYPSKPKPKKKPVKEDKSTVQRPAEHFYRLTKITTSELIPGIEENQVLALPESFIQSESLDLSAPVRKNIKPPAKTPLVPWSRLWPVLRQLLTETQQKKRPDLQKLVKILAHGQQSAKIPQLQKQNWTAGLRILIDRPKRLDLFNDDYCRLLADLKKMRGESGLEIEMLQDTPGGFVFNYSKNQEKQLWRMPQPETPLLILSDLGVYENTGMLQKKWEQFGRKLQSAGCTAYVLMPVPARYLSKELITYYHCISWDRFSALQKIELAAKTQQIIKRRERNQQRLLDSLPWLSPLIEIEPEILRSIRYQLFKTPLDVSFEAEFWNHDETISNSCYSSLVDDKIQHYRDKLAQHVLDNKQQAKRLYQLIKRNHRHKFLLDFYEELNQLAKLADCEDDLAKEAADYLSAFVKVSYQQSHHIGLRHHAEMLLNRQSLAVKKQQQLWSSLWGIIQSRIETANARPDWLDAGAAYPFLNQSQSRQFYQIVQQGEQLFIGTNTALLTLQQSELDIPLFVLAEFDSSSSLTVLEVETEQGQVQTYDYQLSPQGVLTGFKDLFRSIFKLHVSGYCYVIEFLPKPSWATGIGWDAEGLFVTVPWLNELRFLYWQRASSPAQTGQWLGNDLLGVDEYGLYADLKINDIVQRFLWIEAGTFIMGSPETEVDRYNDEDLHQVTLTQGFWLADTAVTQALWLAVMGKNPSRFTDDLNNPVESVGWDDVQAFIDQLNTIMPELHACLPTEAQWEYACRAGTQTPFSFGDNITPEQVNYNGGAPYANGKKGLYREQTVAVKSLPANQWGLYEMHGNVWEWCRDGWQEKLGEQAVTGSVQAVNPDIPERVVRGGSWIDGGRLVRSAFRGGHGADGRDFGLGFRLSLGLQAGRVSKASVEDSGSRVAEQRQAEFSTEAGQQEKDKKMLGLMDKLINFKKHKS